MTVHYVDSSAWMKLVADEAESAALERWVDERLDAGDTFASSHLLVTEMFRAAAILGVPALLVAESLSVVTLTLPEVSTFRAAGLLPGRVRSLDALHVAAALDLRCDDLVSYDDRQIEAAAAAGIPHVSPTQGSAMSTDGNER